MMSFFDLLVSKQYQLQFKTIQILERELNFLMICSLRLNIIYFSNSMKTRTKHLEIIQKTITEQSEADCSCQILNSSLSGVGDSDCSCSQCLQANLQAFNELKELQTDLQKENDNKYVRGASSRVITTKQTRQINRNVVQNDEKTRLRLNEFRSVDRNRETVQKYGKNVNFVSSSNLHQEIEQPLAPGFSPECINDYIKITQYRARQYLNKRKLLQKSEMQERQTLKDMIKENLQALKFTVRVLREEQNDGKFQPDYKWSHKPYHCKNRSEARKKMPYDPDLKNKRQQIQKIKERIKQYQEKNKKQNYECPDQCPNHHLRTSKKKLAEIEKYIKQKAEAFEQKKRRELKEEKEKAMIRAAKLRAIDLRCKKIVAKSKKYDPNISRTSFHNSLEHFSTFSEMKLFNLQRLQQKQKKMKLKKTMKQGGAIEQKIYENLSDFLIGDHPPIHSKIGTESRYKQRQNEENQQWCQKIVKQAKIKPPKQMKKDDVEKREVKKNVSKDKETEKVQKINKNKKQIEKKLKKQEEKRKELQAQIDRKREEIFKEYQKRNSAVGNKKEDSNNKKIRKEYEASLKNQKSPSSRPATSKKEEQYDPYRQVYKQQPTKDSKQLKVVGDPLLQQYEYHKNVGKFKEQEVDQDREIFTKSGTSLKNKQFLKI